MIFKEEQRAIGEWMIEVKAGPREADASRAHCFGYGKFLKRLKKKNQCTSSYHLLPL